MDIGIPHQDPSQRFDLSGGLVVRYSFDKLTKCENI
jgi:hypothetical protein